MEAVIIIVFITIWLVGFCLQLVVFRRFEEQGWLGKEWTVANSLKFTKLLFGANRESLQGVAPYWQIVALRLCVIAIASLMLLLLFLLIQGRGEGVSAGSALLFWL